MLDSCKEDSSDGGGGGGGGDPWVVKVVSMAVA